MKRSIAIILLIFMLCLPAGCSKTNGNGAGASAVPDAALTDPAGTPRPTPGPTEQTAEPTPDLDPETREALRIAESHGLSADDLRGEYALFIEFAETVEGNAALGKYGEFVCRIFPVIADHTEYIEKEFLLERLAELSFNECDLEPGLAGQYQSEPNAILIDKDHITDNDCELPSIVFHELMHFLDFSFSSAANREYLLDGRRLTSEEFLALPLDDQIRAVIVYPADCVLEGGAELYTAKYFAGGVRWYFSAVEFLTGLEYIYGTEKLGELFFGRDSDAAFAELFFEAGYTEDEYSDACMTLNWYTKPADYYWVGHDTRPEDILIDLYEYKLGEGWQTDERFLYILKSINGVAWSGYTESEHADFLEGVEFNTPQEYRTFLDKVYADLPFRPEPECEILVPVIRDGRFTLAAFAEWADPETGELIHGTVAVEYDFETETPLGCEPVDMDAVLRRYFG